jgi:hypothetical protein
MTQTISQTISQTKKEQLHNLYLICCKINFLWGRDGKLDISSREKYELREDFHNALANIDAFKNDNVFLDTLEKFEDAIRSE